jgi:hypothetical protein
VKTLAITLFESQVARNLLYSDSGALIRVLAKDFKIVIITNCELQPSISKFLVTNSLGFCEVFIFERRKDNVIERLCLSLLKLHNKSNSTKKAINVTASNTKRGILSRLTRKSIHILIRNRFSFATQIRRILSFQNRSLLFDASISFEDLKLDLLFVTSITNYIEDVRVAIYFSNEGIPVLGIPRSWDNLTSHGTLAFQPDLLVVHSEFMALQAKQFQNLDDNQLLRLVAPNYQGTFFPEKRNSPENGESTMRVLFPCMGEAINPDEQGFIHWLVDELGGNSEEIQLAVLQHPAFISEMNKPYNHENVSFHVFPYETTILPDYYDFIKGFDLVISGGTSVLLDSIVNGVDVFYIDFEIVEQDYWASHLRYGDLHFHTTQLLERLSLPRASSKHELLRMIKAKKLNLLEFHKEHCFVEFFTGDRSISLAECLRDAMIKLIDEKLVSS